MIVRPLVGRRVVTTRDEPGQLDELLVRAGAEVLHVPLIEIVDPADGGAALDDHLASLDRYDWVVVTSRHGARRVGDAVAHRELGLAAVGTATAHELARRARRPVAVVPDRQLAAELVAAMPGPDERGRRVLVAQADRAEPTLVSGLRERGYHVTPVIAYRTLLRHPSPVEREAALAADALALASGSAARAWAAAIGTATPANVVAIGPTTARVATEAGLQISHIGADHSVVGLAAAITEALAERP